MKEINETNNIDKIEKINENIDNTKEEKVENKEAKKEVNKNKKSDFVPAYERKKVEKQEKGTTDKKVAKTNKTKSKMNIKKDKNTSETKKEKDNKPKAIKSKITVILIALVVVVVLAISLSLVYIFNNESIEDYNRLMDDYGLSLLYNNQTSNSSDKITKSEAIKLVIGATLKTEDITSYMPDDMLYKTNKVTQTESGESINLDELFNQISKTEKIEEEYTNEYWIRYANSIEFIRKDEITKDNYNEEVTYLEFMQYISKAKTVLLGKKLDIEKEPNFKNYNEYNNETKWMLADLVYNGIIEDKNSRFESDKLATKEIANTLVINHVLKYNLITIDDEKININEAKMPSNKYEFAYTLANVNKKVYETQNYKANENYKNAREVYITLRKNYQDINILVETYYNTLLNIDYTTITPESLYATLMQNTMYMVSEQEIQEYVEYVKTNQIQMTGEAQVQNPIIYFDGDNYRVRTKITYDIQNAVNHENVLFKDTDTKYKLGKDEIYIDVPINENTSMGSYYIIPTSISNIIAGSVK